MSSVSAIKEETQAPAHLTETIVDKLNNPSASSDFDFHAGVNQLLADVGMSAADSGGQLTFYGQDPIVPSPIRFGTTAGLSLAAKTVAQRQSGGIEPAKGKTSTSIFARHFAASAVSTMGFGKR